MLGQLADQHGVDPETGKLITVGPLLRSQLDTRIPLIDFKLLDKVMRELAQPSMKPYLQEIEDLLLHQVGVDTVGFHRMMGKFSENATWALEGINSAWKAAVLMRLGYTQRNVFEGWLRTWAVLGMVPALSPKNVVTHADATGATTGCDVTPLHPPGATSGFFVTRDDPSY